MNDVEWVLTKLEKWVDENKDEHTVEYPKLKTWSLIDVDKLKEEMHKLKEANSSYMGGGHHVPFSR